MNEKALIALAEKLGVGVEALWGVLRTMPVYNAMQEMVMVVLSGAVCFAAWRWWLPRARAVKKKHEWDSDRDLVLGVAYMAIGLSGLTTLIGVGMVASHLLGLLNPDAYALRYIIATMR